MILFQGINSVSLIINQMRNYPRTGERDKGKSKKEKKEKERKTAKCKQYNGKRSYSNCRKPLGWNHIPKS